MKHRVPIFEGRMNISTWNTMFHIPSKICLASFNTFVVTDTCSSDTTFTFVFFADY